MRIKLILFFATFVDLLSQTLYRRIVRVVLSHFGMEIRGLPLWVSPRAHFDYRGGITLGDRCVISDGVRLLTHDYSMSLVAERLGHLDTTDDLVRSAPIEIGDQAFIGMNAMILPGVKVGAGAVVGAGSLVTRDVLADTVVAGNPAVVISGTDSYWDRSQKKFGLVPRRA
jgi:acetyltransferase-like isoleucine patch superfamily enzyme